MMAKKGGRGDGSEREREEDRDGEGVGKGEGENGGPSTSVRHQLIQSSDESRCSVELELEDPRIVLSRASCRVGLLP